MRRVVITGAGIVSCIGHDLARVTQSLKEGQSVEYNVGKSDKGPVAENVEPK